MLVGSDMRTAESLRESDRNQGSSKSIATDKNTSSGDALRRKWQLKLLSVGLQHPLRDARDDDSAPARITHGESG